MAVTVDIPGIGEVKADNAASESTLREILRALGGRSGAQPSQAGGGAGGGAVGAASGKAAKNVTNLGKASSEGASAIKSMAKAAGSIVGGVFNQLLSAATGTIGAVTGVGVEMMKGADSIHSFTKNVPILGQFTGIIENQVQVFKDLSAVGAGFSNDMFELTRVAGEAGLSQQTFAETVANNTEGLRLFGSSVQDGSRRFARLSKEFRTSDMGMQLRAMGFTTQELNENLINYNEFLQGTGRNRLMTDKQLAEQSAKYALELDKIAKLSGKSRKELEAEMRQKNTDIRRQVALMQMSDDQQIKFGANLELAGSKSKEFEAALLDMADGVANDPVTQQLMANSPTFRKFAEDVENMKPEEFNNFMKNVGTEMQNLAMKFKDGGVDAAMNSTLGDALRIGGQIVLTQETTAGAMDKEQTARDNFTATITQSTETLEMASSKLQNAFLSPEGPFKEITDAISGLIPSYETAQTQMDAVADTITDSMNAAWDWLKTDGKEMMENAINYFKTDLLPKITEFVEKLGPIIQDMVAFGKKFLQDPAGTFNDVILPALKDFATNTFLAIGGAVALYFGGAKIAGLLALGFAALLGAGPLGIAALVGGGIAAALGALFAVDKLLDLGIFDAVGKAWDDAVEGIKSAFTGIIDWFKGLMDFDFKGFFKGMIPDWVPFFGDDDEEEMPKTNDKKDGSSWTEKFKNLFNDDDDAEEPKTEPKTSPKSRRRTSYEGSNTEGNTDLAMLNTNMRELIDLQKKNNRLVGANSGNLMTS